MLVSACIREFPLYTVLSVSTIISEAAGVQSNTTTVRCGMNGNWRQVTNIDLTNSSQSCPNVLNLRTINSQRLCEAATSSGCSSATFSTSGVQFSTVCGRIIGYQDRGVEAFEPYFSNPSLTIDSAYVEGVILTHGTSPRTHIWTFAAAIDETSGYYQEKCPCSNVDLTQTAPIPPWVGNDYFCDSGTRNVNSDWNRFHPEDPLWDGMGCGPSSTCCSLNNPPWFLKRLSSPTTNDIEMRVCAGSNDETPIEMIELYIM